MQPAAPVVLALALFASAAALRMHQEPEGGSPDEVRLDMEFRAEDSFGNTALTPSCSKIECGEYSCPTPFELKVDGTCCGYCWAPDHLIAVDRHVAVPYNSTGNVVEQCDSAPSVCSGPGTN